MIDLHMHTTYSDGTDATKEILEKASNLGLEMISITDHNSVKAYFEIENDASIKKIFNGEIICGCEFTTTYNKQLIEVLGYGIDYKVIDEYLSKYYTLEEINKYSNTMYNRIIDKLISLGYEFNLSRPKNRKFDTEFFNLEIYQELIKYDNNKSMLEEEGYKSFSDFLRKGITNPRSNLFVDCSDLKPSLQEIIDIIHSANGIAFLAHPYQYAINNMESFLKELTSNYNLDGIECYHTTFTSNESKSLLTFAKNNNLCISGGSDYHGTNKKNHNLAVGRGNLNISKDITKNWNIKKA